MSDVSRKKVAAAVRALDALDTDTCREAAGPVPDGHILLEFIPSEVTEAYERLVQRCYWWSEREEQP